MPIGANIELANTFNDWRTRTNEIIAEFANVVKVGSPATGNATITGWWTSNGYFAANGSASAPGYAWASAANSGFYWTANQVNLTIWGTARQQFGSNYFNILDNSGTLNFGASADATVTRDAAATIALKHGTTASTLRVYGTTTGPRYGSITHTGTTFQVLGGSSDSLQLGANATASWTVTAANSYLTADGDWGLRTGNGSASIPTQSFGSDPDTGFFRAAAGHIGVTSDGTEYFRFEGDTLQLRSGNAIKWSSGAISPAGGDLALYREGAGILAQRNGTNAQELRLYNTYTNSTNYERGILRWDSNGFDIGTVNAGTGSARTMRFYVGGVSRWTITTSGHIQSESDNSYDIGSSGAARPRNIYIGTNVVAGGKLYMGAGVSSVQSPSSGVIGLYNAAENDFSRLQLGGTTASFPALKRSGTTIQVRLADDSAYAPIEASNATFSALTTMASANVQGVFTGTGAATFSNTVTLNGSSVSANTTVRYDTANGRLVLPVGVNKWATS